MTNDRILHVGAPNLGDRELFDKLVDEIFERRWFTNSGQVEKEFEAKLCKFLGVKHCIPVCNATIGLQLACHALGLTGEVIVPAFTFVATPHAVQWAGAKPVFADVDLDTHTICPESVESLITKDTSAIVGVHVWGQHCDTDALDRIASKHNLKVMYDAAHAFACSQNGTMIGNFGQCEVFSFHATKFFNTFEGGAISTNDDALAEKIRQMKNFGFSAPGRVAHLGTNAKMSEISAAMGLSVFERLDQILAHNQTNYLLYRKLLDSIDGVCVFNYDHLTDSNWQYIVLEVDENQFGMSRDQLHEQLNSKNVRARKYFHPGCHEMDPYSSRCGFVDGQLSRTEALCKRVLCLPTGTAVSTSDVERVCETIKNAIEAEA